MKHILAFAFYFLFFGCINTNNENKDEGNLNIENETVQIEHLKQSNTILPIEIVVKKDVSIRSYYKWMDSVVATQNEKLNYIIDEYLIVHNNKWIIDTLAHTDYYYLMDKGIFNEDSKALIALKKGQILVLPDSVKTQELKEQLQHTHLDLNIPEFRLRIMQDEKEIYSFPVRVGQNGKRYLAMAKGDVDMRTKAGVGKIIRVNKHPIFINPRNNHKYKLTRRDDGNVTQLPAIPWLEPEIDGVSYGQLIHPTTNLATLEKASSNGCIGLRESDAWYVYYYAPLDTKVVIRYHLNALNDKGETIQFKDIYSKYDTTKLKNNTTEKSLNKANRILDTSCNHIAMH